MNLVSCQVEDSLADPLFEVFDGGDFVLSSYRDIEADRTEMRIYFPDAGSASEAAAALRRALELVGAGDVPVAASEIPDEDWKFSYRRHFRTERVGRRLLVVPAWEAGESTDALARSEGRETVTMDPGLAFGTGRHETTRACLEYIDGLSSGGGSFLDMGCGSGILSIAAAKLGFSPVGGFDIDGDAVSVACGNAAANGVRAEFRRFALGGGAVTLDDTIEAAKGLYPDLAAQGLGSPAGTEPPRPADLAVANILGPLLVAFAAEIASYAKRRLVVSGILNETFPEVLSAFAAHGFSESSRKVAGEWTTALLERA